MIDGGLRKLFHFKMASGFHWQAIETGGTGLGIPDSNYCADGVEGWVEYKKTDSWSVGLRPEQIAWHMTRAERGGRTFIAIRRTHDGGPRKGDPVDQLWLCQGKYARHLSRYGIKALEIEWEGTWSGGPSGWNWGAVREALTSAR